MEHSQIREQVRKMHQEMGILLSQMESAEVPAGETPSREFTDVVIPELQDYVMEVKDLSERKRALAAAKKLQYPIDESSEYRIGSNKMTHFHAMQAGSWFFTHGNLQDGDTPITLVEFERLAGIDPLEGKAVEGFSGAPNIG